MVCVAVYCASRHGDDPVFAADARATGAALARAGADVVYGGGHIGLMGEMADAALAGGARVTGVITEQLREAEIAHQGLHELLVVPDMTARKLAMSERADAFLALPGGVGTMEELFEVLCWGYLGLHPKPVGLLDTAGYYDHLLAFLRQSVERGMTKARVLDLLRVDDDPARLVWLLLDSVAGSDDRPTPGDRV
ncbi:MAG: TIGR00730 family Rossman fold protein [Microthrixaceae bacterium]